MPSGIVGSPQFWGARFQSLPARMYMLHVWMAKETQRKNQWHSTPEPTSFHHMKCQPSEFADRFPRRSGNEPMQVADRNDIEKPKLPSMQAEIAASSHPTLLRTTAKGSCYCSWKNHKRDSVKNWRKHFITWVFGTLGQEFCEVNQNIQKLNDATMQCPEWRWWADDVVVQHWQQRYWAKLAWAHQQQGWLWVSMSAQWHEATNWGTIKYNWRHAQVWRSLEKQKKTKTRKVKWEQQKFAAVHAPWKRCTFWPRWCLQEQQEFWIGNVHHKHDQI